MTSYQANLNNMRSQRDEKILSDPLHWLSLAGLFWLEEGENSFGSDESNKIALPAFPAPRCGSLYFENGKVTLRPAKDVTFSSNRSSLENRLLISDVDKEPDLINIGNLTMKIIVRGSATLVRIWDREAPAKKEFTGFKYYPAKEEYVVKAKYIRSDPPKTVKRVDVIGTETEGAFLGQAQFTLHGVNCTLEAEKDGNELLFHFTDGTSKITTYGGGRKFRIPQTDKDEIVLDFNLTENWPCAYTPFATCPVVINENRLPIKIEAGEKNYFDYE